MRLSELGGVGNPSESWSDTGGTALIRSIADILEAFVAEEAKKLSEYNIKHGPTIGAMYEGLSMEVINRAVPLELGLQVVNGFVVDAQGGMSGQIDCMLVRGHGEDIPHTNAKKWPVWDVLAVFEVKKTLRGVALGDAFDHLRGVHRTYEQWLFGSPHDAKPVEISRALRAFSRITGVHAPAFNEFDKVLPPDLAFIYHTMVMEQLAPVRIVLGYHGYTTERGLRKALIGLLERRAAGPEQGAGYGVASFPQLITCNGFSLCKATGQPYMAPLIDGYWEFLSSSPTNPLWLMLELIWTKIENTCGIALPWDNDLVEEVFHPLVAARAAAGKGWEYKWRDIDRLENSAKTALWQPREISDRQYAILNLAVERGGVDTRDREFLDCLRRHELTLDAAVSELVGTGFVAMDGPIVRPAVRELHFVITPDGKMFAGEHAGQIESFVMARAPKRSP